MDAYNITSKEEIIEISKSVKEGLNLFKNIFGIQSKSMIAPCYIWDDYIEKTAHINGVKYIQGGYIQRHSLYYAQKKENGFRGTIVDKK